MNNIVLCGFMGSGKTVVGKKNKKILGVKFVGIRNVQKGCRDERCCGFNRRRCNDFQA